MQKGQLKYTTEYWQRLAESKGCQLVGKYIGIHKKHKWRCAEGDIFPMTPANFRRQNCPICSKRTSNGEIITKGFFELFLMERFIKKKHKWLKNRKGNPMELDGFNEKLQLAFEYHGGQHSRYVKHFHKNISLEERQLDDKLKRQQCKDRGIILIEVPETVSFEDIGNFVLKELKKKGFKVIVEKPDFDYKHFLKSRPNKIKEMQALAESKGGKCLSKKYVNARKHLLWECAKGHKWPSSPDNVKRYWCKICADRRSADKKMSSIEERKKQALVRGFIMLSNTNKGARRKHKYMCKARGHITWKTPDNVNRGKGCRYCRDEKNSKIQKRLAKERGGVGIRL